MIRIRQRSQDAVIVRGVIAGEIEQTHNSRQWAVGSKSKIEIRESINI
jgi:hypothetical protein